MSTMTNNWFNAERVSQPGSVILNEWMASRQNARQGPKAAVQATPVSGILPGTEMYSILTGGSLENGAGVAVTEQTAMAVAAVYACIGLIGGALASVPLHFYRRSKGARMREDHRLWWMFNESPWANWTASSAWMYTVQSVGLMGDSFWEIKRRNRFSLSVESIEGFEPHHPNRVYVDSHDDGSLFYLVQDRNGTIRTVEAEDMLHFTGVGFDGKRSLSPLRAALRSAAGIAIAADQHAGSFFRNGARPDFVIKSTGNPSEDQLDAIRKTWHQKYQGPLRSHLPAVLSGGMEVQELTMSAEDAQLIATRNFQVQDIARIYGVPPHMIGYTEKTTSWGSGIESMSIGFVRYTLRRYMDAFQQEINRKLWPRNTTLFAEFNADALQDGDSKAQAEYFAKALGGPGSQGWMTINEIRRLKNLPPIEGGDRIVWAGRSQTEQPEPPESPDRSDDRPGQQQRDDESDSDLDSDDETDGD